MSIVPYTSKQEERWKKLTEILESLNSRLTDLEDRVTENGG